MIELQQGQKSDLRVCFKGLNEEYPFMAGCEKLFTGEYLQCFFAQEQNGTMLYIGCGDEKLGVREIKELFAALAKAAEKAGAKSCEIDAERFWQLLGEDALMPMALGLRLGEYKYCREDAKLCGEPQIDYYLQGVPATEHLKGALQAAVNLACGIVFAKEMTNRPGNLLHPMDFERYAVGFLQELPIEKELLVYGQLKAEGLSLLAGIGASSEFPPCLLVLRYKGAPKSDEITVLCGKGVTCDTGGYCIKSASSMKGIKGDMAGAAAVVGAMYALCKNGAKVNVTACLPLCENRISQAAILPGDVLRAYNGKTVEILNTDAEGRLILADAVAYAAKNEKPSRIIDIATLTGAAWAALGYTMAPAMCDDELLYNQLMAACRQSGECYVRFPFGKEHRKMLESTVADIKNIGSDCCGTITAGLFIREFANGLPWLHLDIAGTAWAQSPNYEFEQAGATGAGTATLYELLKGEMSYHK